LLSNPATQHLISSDAMSIVRRIRAPRLILVALRDIAAANASASSAACWRY